MDAAPSSCRKIKFYRTLVSFDVEAPCSPINSCRKIDIFSSLTCFYVGLPVISLLSW
jgi:hypothetical protein